MFNITTIALKEESSETNLKIKAKPQEKREPFFKSIEFSLIYFTTLSLHIVLLMNERLTTEQHWFTLALEK